MTDVMEETTFERLESEVRSYARSFPKKFKRATGVWMETKSGERYLDFLSGCSSLNYGHNDPVLKQALLDYIAEDGIAHSLDLHTMAKEAFLEEFESTILKPRKLDYKVMFTGPTGANAVEAALKIARKVTGRHEVIAFTNGFHGMTLGALACTGNEGKRGGAGMPLSGVTRMPFNGYMGDGLDTAEYLDQVLSDPSSGIDAPAAIILETVQGEGGLNAASPAWLKRIAAIARRHGALLIADDIQAGCGRTGSFFSFEAAGLKPDVVTLAKSLSGMGLPFAVTLIKREFDIWKPGEHNGTFRGNCHAFVTATTALKHYWRSDELSAKVEEDGRYVSRRLRKLAAAIGADSSAVKGRGMMLGLDMGSGERASEIVRTAFENGLIIETSGGEDEVVKILPALTIARADLEKGMDIVEAAVRTTARPLQQMAGE